MVKDKILSGKGGDFRSNLLCECVWVDAWLFFKFPFKINVFHTDLELYKNSLSTKELHFEK